MCQSNHRRDGNNRLRTKALRRSKKQPEYDPNELADLIDTPAVGKGVGSHLLTSDDAPEKVTTVVALDSSSVADSVAAPVDTTEPAPIVPGRKSFPAPPDKEALPMGSGDISEVTTVSDIDMTPVVATESPPVATCHEGPVDTCPEEVSKATTVVTSSAGIVGRLWISESGEILPESRVHRIAAAADALSNGEEMLYQFLWRSLALRDSGNTRSIQAGYDVLSKGTGFSRKTIQRTIDRLIAKHYIEIETPADIYRRTATVYRVFGPDAVLDRLARRDCTHVAKIGPGVAFMTPLGLLAERPDTLVSSEPSTLVTERESTVDYL
jgi:hypothetical protein